MNDARRQLILGTAGHIDHGKTSLVRRLTGVDTDRLPEEKKRGITIELGFANLDLPEARFGVVDVPGHERFVHNMVAGAAGVDLALLVVAADDSVMPQTREHLAILQLLGIRCGLVALTKIDLVDDETRELVIEELRETLAGTFLEHAPIVPVSNATGAGFDDLRRELGNLAASYVRPAGRSVFRLPIDRAFALAGHGVVVTGTVYGGSAAVGDELVLIPSETPVRIRNLQSHNADAARVETGQRAAINLAGVKLDQVQRGDELAAPGYLTPSRRLLVELTVLPSAKPLKDRQLHRLHLATREATARVILKGGTIAPGETGIAELRLREPMTADYGQRFILRRLSPVETLGGGRVLDPAIPPRMRLKDLAELGRRLGADDPAERLAGWLEHQDLQDMTPNALACRLGVDTAKRAAVVEKLLAEKRLVRMHNGAIVQRARREALAEKIVERCRREIKRRPPSRAIERSVLSQATRRLASPALLEALVDDLIGREKLVKVGDKIGLPGVRATLTKNQQKTLAALVEQCKSAGSAPPTVAELAKSLDAPPKEVTSLAGVAVEDGLLVRVADGLYYETAALDALVAKTVGVLTNGGRATVAEFRDLWGVSRKHAVPLCEYLDAQGITRRDGDVRTLGAKAPPSAVDGGL